MSVGAVSNRRNGMYLTYDPKVRIIELTPAYAAKRASCNTGISDTQFLKLVRKTTSYGTPTNQTGPHGIQPMAVSARRLYKYSAKRE